METAYSTTMTKKSSYKFDTLSKRLDYVLKYKNISQAELARQIGVKQQVIQYLCSKSAQKSKFTYVIAHALDINSEWLATGMGSIFSNKPTCKSIELQQEIPILEWHQILTWMDDEDSISLQNHNAWILANAKLSKKSYAIVIKDKSMHTIFDVGTVIVIDPSAPLKDTGFTLVYIHEYDEIIFRHLLTKGTEKLLTPTNTSMYNVIRLSDKDRILGTMKEARWQP